jgi:tRNA threonylcarbamoyladenosine biosynthesis protein TsaE
MTPRPRPTPASEGEFVTRRPAETRAAARRLAGALAPRAVLALHGDLGSGKTCFVQGLAEALGVDAAVTSPTFTLIHEYPGAVPLYHIDLYRMDTPDQALGIGLEEYFESEGITVIEWAERAGDLIPDHAWHLYFEVLPGRNRRRIRVVRPPA